MGEAAIQALGAETYPDCFEISIASLPKPNWRLDAMAVRGG